MNEFCIAAMPPRPLFTPYSYLADRDVPAGARVKVPLGPTETVIAVCVGQGVRPEGIDLKTVIKVLDDEPLFDDKLLAFLRYAAHYYQHPFGEVLAAAMPNLLAQGKPNRRKLARFYQRGAVPENCGDKQRRVLDAVPAVGRIAEDELREKTGVAPAYLKDLAARGWLIISHEFQPDSAEKLPAPAPALNAAQQAALNALNARTGFAVDVLDGVTGSGKTEVYIRRIQALTQNGGQVLLMAPEIGIAEILYQRLRARLDVPVGLHHSGMTDHARLAVWQAVKAGDVQVLIGTRSALFSAFCDLRGIIVDECHDQSYKQQDTFRYNGRDMAIVRAKMFDVPIVLGSATPSLESWKHMLEGRWQRLQLPYRAAAQSLPKVTIEDVRHVPVYGGLSQKLITEINRQLQAGQQSMLFLNRRGYAPVLHCSDCGWKSQCTACDALMTAHTAERCLQCHHCGRKSAIPTVCPSCGSRELQMSGLGTQKLEQSVKHQFPNARVLRIDTDNFTSAAQFQQAVTQVKNGECDIVLGTQWLSKGHHFPNLQLAAIIDADGAFFSTDYRAEERLAQLLVQVGGRAGRESSGHIWVQTQFPEHPIFHVLTQPYELEARRQLEQRAEIGLPPFGAQALLFARHKDLGRAMHALTNTKTGAREAGVGTELLWLGPAPAVIARKDGQHRAQLILQAESKAQLQRELPVINDWLLAQGKALSVRVGMDVDPFWLD